MSSILLTKKEERKKKKTIGLIKIMLISTYVTERSNEKGAQTLWCTIDQCRLTHPDFPQIRHMFDKIIFEFEIDFIDRKIKEKNFFFDRVIKNKFPKSFV